MGKITREKTHFTGYARGDELPWFAADMANR
jgi:hypothetical protein